MSPMRCTIATAVTAAALVAAGPATAHQTAYDGRAAVTVHVSPDDEPVAGSVSTIRITRVKVRGGRFSFRSGRTKMTITDSAGSTLLKRRVSRTTRFTFPRAGAYQITVRGRYKRHKRFHRFRTAFAVRAS